MELTSWSENSEVISIQFIFQSMGKAWTEINNIADIKKKNSYAYKLVQYFGKRFFSK